jgi:GR25 family glycosyltransferase involved in LPS biosynthesis
MSQLHPVPQESRSLLSFHKMCTQSHFNGEHGMRLPFSSARMIVMPGRGEKEMLMLRREGLDVKPFKALTPTPEIIEATVAPEKLKEYTKGMVGCYLSHRALWAELLTQPPGSTMLIFEDDVQLPTYNDANTPLVDQIEAFMLEVPEDWDVVFLGRCWDWCLECKHITKGIVQTKNALCLHAYALTQRAAHVLLGSNSPMNLAVDVDLVRLLRNQRIKGYAKTPQILQQDNSIESTSQIHKHIYQPECRPEPPRPEPQRGSIICLVILALITAMVAVIYSQTRELR